MGFVEAQEEHRSFESTDGVHWSDPVIVLGPNPSTGWEEDINRPVVVKRTDGYHMWYTGQTKDHSSIGYATSADGVKWKRMSERPVLTAERAWEKVAVMCPHVMWDSKVRLFRMWYSGGEQYEPDAIGYATSADGLRWQKLGSEPVFQADATIGWEKYKVTACQVIVLDGWYYMFYIGFRDIDHAQIGIARSRNGVSGWERLAANPILSPGKDEWMPTLVTSRSQFSAGSSGGYGTTGGRAASNRSAWPHMRGGRFGHGESGLALKLLS